ncbi:MAG TPA: OmpA family protein, partial [Spirochaetota bacterium]|nr:OmpA family protein [Spirochaetota bacterium]
VKEVDGKKMAIITYAIPINKNPGGKRFPPDVPVKISGQYTGTLLWNISENRPVESENRYSIMMLFAHGRMGNSIEFRMGIKEQYALYDNVTSEEKEKQKQDLKDEIPEDSGISVDDEKRGLVLRLAEILFSFDKFTLREDAKKNLEKMAEIIKRKYPDREIIVEGHTDNIGGREYNQKLSEKRARSVAEYLGERLGHDKISFRGLGQEQPIADNGTKEGRQKNRRVEIIIKLN